jgi:YD repeat-containing protein
MTALSTYDANGNTLSDPSGKSYSWDFENRLTQAVVPGTGTVAFKYDPFGRRIQKSGPLGTTNYLYDGDWANVIEEVDGTGSVVARYTQEELGLDLGAGPSFRWFNPDAGALPLSRFVRQGGGFDFPFPEETPKTGMPRFIPMLMRLRCEYALGSEAISRIALPTFRDVQLLLSCAAFGHNTHPGYL